MNNIYDLYSTDLEKEVNGAPVKFGEATLYIASSNSSTNSKYAECVASFVEKNTKRQLAEKDDKREQLRELYAEAVLVGWENVKDKDGKDLPYSKQNALKLLTDLPRLFEEIITISSDINYYREEQREAAAKN